MRVTSFSGERLARIKSDSGGSKSFRSLNVEQILMFTVSVSQKSLMDTWLWCKITDGQRQNLAKVSFDFDENCLQVLSTSACRHYLVGEGDRDRRCLPRPQGLPQTCSHPLFLVHQHGQLWPDADCKCCCFVEIAHVAFFRATLSTTSLSLGIMMSKWQRLPISTQVDISLNSMQNIKL